MSTIRESVISLTQNPWGENQNENLEMIRSNWEESVPVLKEILTNRYLDPGAFGMSEEELKRCNEQDLTPLSQIAAASLLGENKDAEAFNLLLDVYLDAGELSRQPILADSLFNVSIPIFLNTYTAEYLDKVENLIQQESTDPELLNALLAVYVQAYKNGHRTQEEVRPVVKALWEAHKDEGENSVYIPHIVYTAANCDLTDLKEEIRPVWDEYEKQFYVPLDNIYEDHFGFPEPNPDTDPYVFEDFLKNAEEFSYMCGLGEEDMNLDEDFDLNSIDSISDSQLEALANHLAELDQPQIIDFMQKNPVLGKKVLSYIRKKSENTDVLKNRKSTGYQPSMSEFQSKKKKKGGKNASKKAAKKGSGKSGKKKK